MEKGERVPDIRRHRKRGHTTVEFTVVAGMILATLGILTVLLATFGEYGTRVLDLVGSEYP